MEQTATSIMSPILQYGFAGLSGVLLAINVWLVAQLLKLLEKNNAVIAANTQAIVNVSSLTKDLLKLVRSMHTMLVARPCIARFAQSPGPEAPEADTEDS